MREPRGFTLIEVMVAMCLAMLFLLITSGLELNSIHGIDRLKRRQQALQLSSTIMHRLQGEWTHGSPANMAPGEETMEGNIYTYSIDQSALGLPNPLVQTLPADVGNQPWQGMHHLTVTIKWENLQMVRTMVVTQTVANTTGNTTK